MRKIGLHTDRTSNKADSASREPSERHLAGLGLQGLDVGSLEPSPYKRTRPHSSIGLPGDSSSFRVETSPRHGGEGDLLRSPSNANSTFPGIDDVSKAKNGASDPLGLHLVCDTPRPSGDIIFVHGLGGTAKKTWSWERDVDYFWPGWLTEEDEFSTQRIFTYGYNSNFKGAGTNLNVIDFAKDLLFQMLVFATDTGESQHAIGNYPIIFVVHSMGGLVVKKAYVLGEHDAQYAHLIRSVRGIMFLATPHRGSHYAKILNNILSTSLLGAPSKAYIDDLDTRSRALQDINEQFRTSCDDLLLFSFYETFKTSLGFKKSLIVEKESATLGYPREGSNALNADHHTICKFKNREDRNYVSVKRMLRLWVTESVRSQASSKCVCPLL